MPNDVSRRELLSALGIGALAAKTAAGADEPPQFSSLDHLEFFVSNVEKSAAFYAQVFGAEVMKNNRTTRRYVRLGAAYRPAESAVTVRTTPVAVSLMATWAFGMTAPDGSIMVPESVAPTTCAEIRGTLKNTQSNPTGTYRDMLLSSR